MMGGAGCGCVQGLDRVAIEALPPEGCLLSDHVYNNIILGPEHSAVLLVCVIQNNPLTKVPPVKTPNGGIIPQPPNR